jgi:hypothetical protein
VSVIVVAVILTALLFDFTNGFHDTANAMATSITSGALRPKVAVVLAGVLNLIGAFLSVQVARTISSGLVDDTKITPVVIFAGLVGAILWNRNRRADPNSGPSTPYPASSPTTSTYRSRMSSRGWRPARPTRPTRWTVNCSPPALARARRRSVTASVRTNGPSNSPLSCWRCDLYSHSCPSVSTTSCSCAST